MGFVTTEIDQSYARIRLAAGVTNVLTRDMVTELSAAVREAQTNARGIMLCGGDKFFCNGLDLEWGLNQSRHAMREFFSRTR